MKLTNIRYSTNDEIQAALKIIADSEKKTKKARQRDYST